MVVALGLPLLSDAPSVWWVVSGDAVGQPGGSERHHLNHRLVGNTRLSSQAP